LKADPKNVARLAQAERELAGTTAEFAQQLAQRVGPVRCLELAAAAMRSATAELEQQHLTNASGLEETALAELIKARQNLRQMLSESSSSSSCRQVDNQQRQQLRPQQPSQQTQQSPPKPPQDPKKEEPQRAKDLQQRIEKLAQSQRQCASQCRSAASSSSSQSSPSQRSQSQGAANSAQQPRPDGSPPSSQASAGKPSERLSERPSASAAKSQPGSESREAGQKPDASTHLAERQRQAAAEAADIERQMRDDPALTELAVRRMREAGATVRDSANSLQAGRRQQAGQEAGLAADQLERLSRQVAGLKTEELAEKLNKAASLANQLARQQQQERSESPRSAQVSDRAETADRESAENQENFGRPGGSVGRPATAPSDKSGPQTAERQRGLAEEARTLGDFLQQFQQAARDVDAKLAEALREAREANPPAELATQMEHAAEALQAARPQHAQRAIGETAQRLDALAQQLDAARRGFVQPHLEQLLAAEKQAAELQQDLEKRSGRPTRSEIERRTDKLEKTLDALGQRDETLGAAATRFSDTVHRRGRSPREPTLASGYYEPDELARSAVQRAIRDLQVRIQEIILKDAFLDQDEPVPPQFQKQVETYYRVLSEDLSGK
jgi:hypothetical protein